MVTTYVTILFYILIILFFFQALYIKYTISRLPFFPAQTPAERPGAYHLLSILPQLLHFLLQEAFVSADFQYLPLM